MSRLLDHHGLVTAAPVKLSFRDYVSGKVSTPSFREAMQTISDSGVISGDVMSYADVTLDAIEDERSYGNLLDDSMDMNYAAALRKWTDEDGDPPIYNYITRTSYMRDRSQMSPILPLEWLILKGLQHLPPVKIDTVFRAVRGDIAEQYKEGRKFTWHAPASTTERIQVLESEQFSGTEGEHATIFVIKLTQKQARDISKYATYDESEILLPPGCRFKVISKMNKHNFSMIHIEEIFSNEWVIDLSHSVAKPPEQLLGHSCPEEEDNKCTDHTIEDLQVWCLECVDASCTICSVSNQLMERKEEFSALSQEEKALLNHYEVSEDVSQACASIQAEALSASKEVNEWVNKHNAYFDAMNEKTRADIKRLEAEIASVEEKRIAIKKRGDEIQQMISEGSAERITALNPWNTGQSDAVQPEEMQKYLSEGKSDLLQVLRELSEFVTAKANKPTPVTPEPPPLFGVERSGSEASAALSELQDVLAKDHVTPSVVNETQVSSGTVFGKDVLTKRSLSVEYLKVVPHRWNPSKCHQDLTISDENRAVHGETQVWKSVLGVEQVESFKILLGETVQDTNITIGFCPESKFQETWCPGKQVAAEWHVTPDYAWGKNRWPQNYGIQWRSGDVVEAVWSQSLGTISFKVNGIDFGTAFEGVFSDDNDRILPFVCSYGRKDFAFVK